MTELLTEPSPAGRRPPQWLVVARWTSSVHLAVAGIALVVGLAAAAVVLTVIAVGWTVDRSFVATVSALLFGVPFVVSLSLVRTHVDAFVPQGATRSAVVAGNLAAAPVSGLLWAGVATALMAAEALAFDVAGWPHGFPDVEGAATWERGWLFLLLVMFANTTMASPAGQLVGGLFQRFHGRRVLVGVLLALPALLPLLATVFLVTGTDLRGPVLDGLLPFDRTVTVRCAAGLGAAIASALGLWLVLRRVPVRPRPA
ncbi:MAG: hypothetical protein ACTHXO_00605 [Actinomycetaceae bacterium]